MKLQNGCNKFPICAAAQGDASGPLELQGSPPLPQIALGKGNAVGVAPQSRANWLLFNDFCVTPTNAAEVTQLYGLQKVPCLLYYKQARPSHFSD